MEMKTTNGKGRKMAIEMKYTVHQLDDERVKMMEDGWNPRDITDEAAAKRLDDGVEHSES